MTSGGQNNVVIQLFVEYQVPNFEMAISFKLRLEYVNYAYHWNRQGIESEKKQMKSIRFNFETLIIPLRRTNILAASCRLFSYN